jgi:hypothetical protein
MNTFTQKCFSPESDDSSGGSGGGEGGQKITIGGSDSVLSIAKAHGLFWKTVWNHPNNAELKEKRKTPEVLMVGDELFVPELEAKKVSKPAEAKHTFKLKGEQAKFKIQLKELGEPRANEEYVLVLNDILKSGKTDADGIIECDIPNDASEGEIQLRGGQEKIPIRLGSLDPVDTPSGVRKRLKNLGFDSPGCAEDAMPEEALKNFQIKNKLKVTGKFDADTKAKLAELHPA